MKTGDFVLDVLHEVEDHVAEFEANESKVELIDDIIRNLVDMKLDLED